MSLEESIKENIDDFLYDAIDTIRGKNHKIPNEDSICKFLNAKKEQDIKFIQNRINILLTNGKLRNKPKNGTNSYFRNYSTNPEILNMSSFSSKSTESVTELEKTYTQPTNDFIKNLKNKIFNELMPDLKLVIREVISASNTENEETTNIDNTTIKDSRNDKIITNLEKEIEFLKHEIECKNKLIDLYSSNLFCTREKESFPKDTENIESNPNFDLELLNSKLVDILANKSIDSTPSPEVDTLSYISLSTQVLEQVTNDKNNLDQQIMEIRKIKHQHYQNYVAYNKIPHDSSPTADNSTTWPKGTTLIAGDSMLHEINESKLCGPKPNSVKVRIFRGATIDDMKDFIKPYLKRAPENIILHIGTNNCVNETSRIVLNKLLLLKQFILSELPNTNIIISNIIDRIDNAKARLTISNFNQHLSSLEMDVIDNNNISPQYLNGSGLHLNSHGRGKFAMNLIKKIKLLNKKKGSRY